MGEKALARIESLVRDLCVTVDALQRRIETLEASARPYTREEILGFLDRFRAGESLGADLFGAWAAATPDSALRGGLRAIELREAGHARLLEQRLKELGGAPGFRAPEDVLPHSLYASPEKSDAEKLQGFLAAVAPERVLADLERSVARLCADPETQALVAAIVCDERATLDLLQHECERRAA